MADRGYAAVMARRDETLLAATGIDYARLGHGVAFDWDGLMDAVGLDVAEVTAIQRASGVGGTPLLDLPNLTTLVRRRSAPGHGARILIKDEAANPSGSFKDRRASLSAHHARAAGYAGLVAATSGNYGAAVASQAARHGLGAIIVQEAFDSLGRSQPELREKARKCEALGAEVIRTSVGPELFYVLLRTLEETGYFNASLYTPFSVAGIATLGLEIAEQVRATCGRDPDVVLATHAGGGMVTGTGLGLRAAGAHGTQLVGVSVDLHGLHMASDRDFNRKSFTTGHTGFSIPFTSRPDRVDVPRNAARPLRYLDRFVTVTQGEVFYATEALARLEGLERGPAGNTSLAAALVVARELPADRVVVVSETEYTGAGKSPVAQLAFAAEMGVEIVAGGRELDEPGRRIAIPTRFEQLAVRDVDLDDLRRSYLRNAVVAGSRPSDAEIDFLVAETRWAPDAVRRELERMAAR
jgi:2-amino-4-ketopentanoate thiolase beta subunit